MGVRTVRVMAGLRGSGVMMVHPAGSVRMGDELTSDFKGRVRKRCYGEPCVGLAMEDSEPDFCLETWDERGGGRTGRQGA